MPRLQSIRFVVVFVLVTLLASTSKAQLSPAFTADVTSGCIPLVVHFQDQTTGGATQWSWNLGNGTISQQQHPTTTYFTAGIYSVKLVVRNGSSSDSIVKTQYIIVRANPLAAFSMSDSFGCFPRPIHFTDQSNAGSGTLVQWTWDFGDGNISTIQNPSHVYASAGNYSVTLKVANSFGCQATLTKQNAVQLQNIIADFSFVNNGGCQLPATIAFNHLSPSAVLYRWDFGDGITSHMPNPTHNYSVAGSYNVKLIVTNTLGCTDSISKLVNVGFVSADFTSPALTCASTGIQFQNTSSPAPLTASWDFGDGTSSSELNPVKIFAAAGTYSVRLIAGFDACADTIVKTIIVRPIPTASFSESGQTTGCSIPATVNFNNTSSGANAYAWTFGNGSSSSSQSPVANYNTFGSFDVSLVASNMFGCSDTLTKSQLVNIRAPQVTSISGLPYSGCVPYTASMSAMVDATEPVVSWLWNFGDGSSSTLASPTHVYASQGSYDVSVIITTAGGCKDTLIVPAAINVNTKPTAAFTASPLVTCAAAPIQFNNQSTGANQWFWTFGDGGFASTEHPSHQFGDTGVFTVMLVASNFGCNDTIIKADYVRNEPPIGRYNIVQQCDDPFTVHFRDSSIGGQTYKWFFGDGDSSTLRHPSHIYRSPGVYNFSFTVYHGSCSYPTFGTVRIVDEHPGFSVSDSLMCKNTPTTFTAQNVNTSNISTYHWDFGDGITESTTSASVVHVYTVTGVFFPRLITTNVLGCNDTVAALTPIRVYGPTARFNNAEGTCVNGTIVFNDSSTTDGIHAITEWRWNFGDGSSQSYSSIPFNHTYAGSGTFDVVMSVRDSYGCLDSVMVPNAVIITDPRADFISADSIKCAANTVQFNNNSVGLELGYQWNLGDSATSTLQNPGHSYAAEGAYNVQLTVVDRFGCTDTIRKQQVIANPTAAFVASDTFATCPPLMVNLANEASRFTTASWSFGDGGMADINNPSHYYTTPGTYDLTLRVNGFGHCVDSIVKKIVIKGPTGSFNFGPTTICSNGTADFTATSRDNAGFIWDFSDGVVLTTTDSIVSHGYDFPGYYQPKLILVDTAGCQVPISSPDTVRVLGVAAKIGFSQTLVCDSTTVQFADSSIVVNDVPATYRWDFGDGGTSSNANPGHYYNQPGNYSVKLVITSQAGCIDSTILPAPISVVSSPRIDIAASSSACVYDTVTFGGNLLNPDSAAVQWQWNFANGSQSSLQNPAQAFGVAGNFAVTGIAIRNGCSDTAIAPILVHPLPTVRAGTDTMICRGQIFTLQPTGAASYLWEAEPTLSCTTCLTPTVNPVTDTRYFVTGTSAFGCKAEDSVIVRVQQPFSLRVSNSDSICSGNSLQLIANGASRYCWFPAVGLSDPNASNPVANPGQTTSYRVIGTDQRNCFRDTGYVNVTVFPKPEFVIHQPSVTLPAGSTAVITSNASADITQWKWTPAIGLSCADCPQPVVTAKDNISYTAEARNDGGCSTSARVTVRVICNDGNVFIPNTFSPNNDGMNDVFYVRGKGINSVKAMKVFDRWGELVFEKNNFNANDPNAGWNGTYRNSILTPDVYVYLVDVVCDNNTVFTLKGNVSLIR